VACNRCDSIEDVSDVDGPYTVRTCDGCGREIKYRVFGKHGIGLVIPAGHQPVIPANFLQISANPLKSTGHLTRSGVAWFAEHVFLENIPTNPDHFKPFLDKLIEQLDQYLRSSTVFEGFDFDDPSRSETIFNRAAENKNGAEWYAYVAALLFTLAKEAIAANNAVGAASAMAGAERFRSLWIFKVNFEEVVWMGQSAKKLTDVLALWRANQANADEEFWQIKLQEASYVFSQLFSVPLTFIQDKAYVGGQQIDGKSSRLVDFLFSGGATGEAMLIEIKTPVTGLLQRTKYRSNVYAPDTELSGSVIQAADYRYSITRDLQSITQSRKMDISTFNPKVVIIIGNYGSELDTEEKRRSFELYRSSLSNIEIVTFDELFRKMEHLAKLFNLVKSEPSSETQQPQSS
jgi:antiviral defense system Shedu protein SduA